MKNNNNITKNHKFYRAKNQLKNNKYKKKNILHEYCELYTKMKIIEKIINKKVP